MAAPRARSAVAASSVSLARSGLVMTEGWSLSAASTRARLVMDFDAGSRTRALTGPEAAGAGQAGSVWSPECIRLSVSSPGHGAPARGLEKPDYGYEMPIQA
jgi:hypothetical protein